MRVWITEYQEAETKDGIAVSIGGIKWIKKWDVSVQCKSKTEAEELKASLEQAEKQEPVKWVGLTDAVMCHISMNHGFMSIDGHDFARAIEAKIKELNR